MTDFFISYTHADEKWAQWIAYVLEEEGYSTIIQAWDFRPGSNFVLEMQKASSAATKTLMVLSPDYLNSNMAAPEWASAFAQDPQGIGRTLVPVMVRTCDPKELLPTIVQIRVVGLSQEAAREALVSGVKEARAKPSQRPAFPGAPTEHPKPTVFPGETSTRALKTSVLPNLRQTWTDADRKRFLKHGLSQIQAIFENNLKMAAVEEPRLEVDFTPSSAVDFSAEIFLDGKSKCRCRIWLSNAMGSESIAFQEGNTNGDAMNEILHTPRDGKPSFSASMAMGMSEIEKMFNMKELSAEDAAAYLWARFVKPLSY